MFHSIPFYIIAKAFGAAQGFLPYASTQITWHGDFIKSFSNFATAFLGCPLQIVQSSKQKNNSLSSEPDTNYSKMHPQEMRCAFGKLLQEARKSHSKWRSITIV